MYSEDSDRDLSVLGSVGEVLGSGETASGFGPTSRTVSMLPQKSKSDPAVSVEELSHFPTDPLDMLNIPGSFSSSP